MSTTTLELGSNLGLTNTTDFPHVIRRDLAQSKSSKPRVVSWIGYKIEKAVDAACAAVGHEPVGKQLQAEVEFRMKKERPLFIHIEQLQDMVENLLIELNYGRVALAYGKHRARRVPPSVKLRRKSQLAALSSLNSPLPTTTVRPPPPHFLRAHRSSPHALGKRVDRAPDAQRFDVTHAGRTAGDRSSSTPKIFSTSMETAAIFAGRILLTYIYEETLPWKIADGIDQLKEAHRKAFLKYIPARHRGRSGLIPAWPSFVSTNWPTRSIPTLIFNSTSSASRISMTGI